MKTFYINPLEIAEKLGIEIITNKQQFLDKFNNISYDKLYGYITVEKDKKPTIFYNNNLSEKRRRFVIAHELAHYFLGHLKTSSCIIDTKENFLNTVSDSKEKEANKIATEILIPEDKLNFLIYKKGITSIKNLAKIMKISEAAMLYRLKNLGWIK